MTTPKWTSSPSQGPRTRGVSERVRDALGSILLYTVYIVFGLLVAYFIFTQLWYAFR